MTATVWERLQKLQDLIEKRQVSMFLGAAALVALQTSWGL